MKPILSSGLLRHLVFPDEWILRDLSYRFSWLTAFRQKKPEADRRSPKKTASRSSGFASRSSQSSASFASHLPRPVEGSCRSWEKCPRGRRFHQEAETKTREQLQN